MHVGIDASSWANERGYGRFTRCLVAALAARDQGFSYTLLFDAEPTYPVPEGVDIRLADAGGSIAASGGQARARGHMLSMARAARRLDCDVFFYPTVYSYFPLPARRPKIVCFHDTIPERFPDLIFPRPLNAWLWRTKTRLARWQATRVMTVSQASAEDLGRYLGIPRAKIDLVTEGPDPVFAPIADPAALARTRWRCGVPEGARLLVYLGGFNRHKNVVRLIEAMPVIQAAHEDVYLAIVGRITGARFWDNVETLQARARDNPRIGFTGEIDDAMLARLLNAAEALVFPSLWEGFGLPAVEAMACGTPVLVSDRGSLPEVVGDAGLVFDPEDAHAIAAQAIRLLGDAGLAADLGRKALVRAERFSWARAAELAEASFRKAAGRGG